MFGVGDRLGAAKKQWRIRSRVLVKEESHSLAEIRRIRNSPGDEHGAMGQLLSLKPMEPQSQAWSTIGSYTYQSKKSFPKKWGSKIFLLMYYLCQELEMG